MSIEFVRFIIHLIVISRIIRPCLDFLFITHRSSLNFRYSSLITHHLKYPTPYTPSRLAPSLTCHHSIFFNCLWDPHTDPMSIDFSLSLSLYLFPPFASPLHFSLFFFFIFPYFSLLFSSSMLTHILIMPTMIPIFMLFLDIQYNQMAIQYYSFPILLITT